MSAIKNNSEASLVKVGRLVLLPLKVQIAGDFLSQQSWQAKSIIKQLWLHCNELA
jgi:hypothetical protein